MCTFVLTLGKSYSQLVFMSTTAGSLWNLPAIQSMCQMEQDKVRSAGGNNMHIHFPWLVSFQINIPNKRGGNSMCVYHFYAKYKNALDVLWSRIGQNPE